MMMALPLPHHHCRQLIVIDYLCISYIHHFQNKAQGDVCALYTGICI